MSHDEILDTLKHFATLGKLDPEIALPVLFGAIAEILSCQKENKIEHDTHVKTSNARLLALEGRDKRIVAVIGVVGVIAGVAGNIIVALVTK